MLNLPVYLDHNATTPCDPAVVDEMLPYFSLKFGNAASRSHLYGWEAKEAVDIARERVASLIGAEPEEIVFTSGGTEANNLALKGVYEMYASKGHHIITTVVEHKSVLDSCHHLEKMGATVTYLPVNSEGRIELQDLENAIQPDTILIAVMYANNELGTIMPVREISRIAKEHGIAFFSDAVQAVGKIPVNVKEDGIDLLSLSAHKIYGPKGVGALYVRRRNPRMKLSPQIDGGGHERGMRSGTLNVPGIVGLGKAAQIAESEMKAEATRLTGLRNKLEARLLNLGRAFVNGSAEYRLPNVSNLSFANAGADALMVGLHNDMAVSSGSACMSATTEPSYVLKAIGLEDDLAYGSLRFSLGRSTTEEEIDYVVDKVRDCVVQLRKANQAIGKETEREEENEIAKENN